ncbi:unnamed protein product [Nippostrongylus brasiliensis]|uniref:CCHC-type domain-containing protein n=1 Tax=Nippostrongylus brasiliensis TaxID=27835 RepID=A0A0N4YM82_NIPBR|nr:unnamed protein product [Nippostrongylus brasiliensis]
MGAVPFDVANHANIKKKRKLVKKTSLKKKCSAVNDVETTKDDSTETSAIADKRPMPTTPEENSSTEINSCKNLKRKKEAKATEDVEVNEEPKLNRKQRKMLKRKMIEEGLLKDPTADPVELAKAFDASAGLKSAENKSSLKRKKKKRDGPAADGAINSAKLTNEDGSAAAPLTKKKRVESAAGGLGHSTASSVHPTHDNAQVVDKFAEILQKLSTVQPASEIHAERKEKVVEMEGTLDDVKPWDAGDIIKRWKNRERRRVDRQISKQTNRICFHCRQSGHLLSECPNRDADEQAVGNIAGGHGDGICFKCGSTEHSVHKCPRKHIKGRFKLFSFVFFCSCS